MTFLEPSSDFQRKERRVNDQKEDVFKKRVLASTCRRKIGKLASRSVMYSFSTSFVPLFFVLVI